MQDQVEFIDRNGTYKTMHIIGVHYQTDGHRESFDIAISGIDDTVIISLSEEKAAKLSRELMTARAAINTIKTRKEKERKRQQQIDDARSKMH